jgi:hypothetical protein
MLVLKQDHRLDCQDNRSLRFKKTDLLKGPFIDTAAEKAAIDATLRAGAIHGVKGESLDAARYLADKDHRKAKIMI